MALGPSFLGFRHPRGNYFHGPKTTLLLSTALYHGSQTQLASGKNGKDLKKKLGCEPKRRLKGGFF
jgi:hypothetical protein